MDLGGFFDEELQLEVFLPEEDLLVVIKSAVTLFVLRVFNLLLDGSFEAENNELFIDVGLALIRHSELLRCLFI